MANVFFKKGLLANLPASYSAGTFYVTTDERAMYLDIDDSTRIRLGDFIQVDAVANLPTAGASTSALYYCVAENILAKWNGSEWTQINKQPTAEEMKTLLGLGTMAYKSEVAEGDLNTDLAKKINDASAANHGHDNKTVLDGITSDKVTAWDNAEKNAKDYADDLDEAMDTRVKAVEAAIGENGSVATQIKTAIEALDYTDTAVTGEYVSAVNEVDGKISVTRVALPDYANTYDAKGAAATAESNAKSYADGLAANYDEKGAAAGVKSELETEIAKKFDKTAYEADKATFAIAETVNAAIDLKANAADVYIKDDVDGKFDAILNGETINDFSGVESALADKFDSADMADILNGESINSFSGVESALADKFDSADMADIVNGTDINSFADVEAALADKFDSADMADIVNGTEINSFSAVESAIGLITTGETINDFGGVEAELDAIKMFVASGDLLSSRDFGDAADLATAVENNVAAVADLQSNKADASFVGTLPEGTEAQTVIDYIDAKTANIASDETVGAISDRVEALEGKFGEGEGTVEAQIAAAVAAEEDARKEAVKGVQDEVDAVEGRMDTAEGKITALETESAKHAIKTEVEAALALKADKSVVDAMYTNEQIDAAILVETNRAKGVEENLQTQINTIMNNPDTEGVINSINEFTQYIADHGEIAEGFRADIDKNREDIAANSKAISDQAASDAATYETKSDAAQKLADAKAYTDEQIAAIPATSWNDLTDKPFYDTVEVTEEVILEESTLDFTNSSNLGQTMAMNVGFVGEVKAGDTLLVTVDGETYRLVSPTSNNGIIMNGEQVNDPETGYSISPDSEYPYWIMHAGNMIVAIGIDAGSHTIGIVRIIETAGEVKTLDDKFISDNIARTADVNAAIEAEVSRANGAYDAKGAAAAAQTAAEAAAAGALASARTEITAEIGTAISGEVSRADAKYEEKGTAQGIVDGLKLAETYEPIGAETRAIAAAEGKVNALADTVYTKEEVDSAIAAAVEAAHTWGSF